MIRSWLRSGKGCDGISRGIAPVSRRQLIPPLRRLRRFCHLCQSPLTSSRKRSSASAVVLFQSYEMQVAALLAAPGDPTPRIDIAWNTNLAYLQADTWSEHRCRRLPCATQTSGGRPKSWRLPGAKSRRSPILEVTLWRSGAVTVVTPRSSLSIFWSVANVRRN